MGRSQIKKLAHQIADDLFTDGWGDKADRLVMFTKKTEVETAISKPGWCKEAVVDRIEERLIKALRKT